MEKIPIPEKAQKNVQKPTAYFTDLIAKRMEKGNFSFIMAAILPMVSLAFLPAISVVCLVGFALYELLLVAGIAWGTKQYYRLYSLPRHRYFSEYHYLFQCLYGLAAATMVLVPSMGLAVVSVWVGSMMGSCLSRLIQKKREHMWQEIIIEFAMAVRVGYPFCLLIAVLVAVVAQICAVM